MILIFMKQKLSQTKKGEMSDERKGMLLLCIYPMFAPAQHARFSVGSAEEE